MSVFVKTIEDIKLGVKVENDTYFEAVDPYLIAAENDYLKPYLGEALFDAMSANDYDAPKLARVAPKIKIAVSCFAFYHIIQEGSLKLNEHGAKQMSSEYNSPAPKWRDDNAKAELIKRADKAIDDLLDILLDNIDDYTEWNTSRWYRLKTGLVISKAADFDQYVPIGSSARVFLRILPDIEKANRLLKGITCTALFDRINTEMIANPSPEILDLMPYLQAVVAYEAIVRTIPRFNFFITPDGIVLYTINDSTFSKNAATSAEKKELTIRYQTNLEEARAELVAYLNENIADYPEYANSTCYGQKTTSKPYYAYPNLKSNKHFAP